ncbi:methyltransferase domain-containing protein [Fischerella thermalis]|uniref:SAM-dependent methyltransferase n=1 Tax=Fischerella thermalis CCMEE 5318 TaxID=2019666 RepID=A0A2N6LPZ7_9CYAN|nr:methyltransferase domain-containing protein [Fischerella thermalis]PMB27991.1 SAM-dependent methyltransferase [Fischerella thermalis CCMEE 5318]
MFESSQPEINVEELMQKIREDVAKRNHHSQLPSVSTSNISSSSIDTTKINWSFSLIEGLLRNAESRAVIRTKWPDNLNRFPYNLSRGLQKIALKILNFIFKDQREVNFNVINALKESVGLNRQLIGQIATLRSQLDECLNIVDTRLQKIDERLDLIDMNLQRLDERLCSADSSIQKLDEHLNHVNNSVQKVDNNFNKIDTQINTSITSIQEHLNTVNNRIEAIDERSIRNESYLKNDLMQQKRLITLFLEEAWQRLPEPFSQQQLQSFEEEKQHLLDALYVAFEDQFRGSRDLILNRLKVYLPLIAEAKVGTPETPILDVGCGRGEWLELLQKSGYAAKGLDINRVMLEQCRLKGLEVIEADVIAYLQSLPDAVIGAITGFHIIEHLPFEALIKLLIETARVLKPGGLAIFETPNPENIIVGSCNFYSDPTHRNPLFPPTVKFLMEQYGFANVELLRLREFRIEDNFKFIEADHPLAPTLNPIIEIIKSHFCAAPDFAVVGKKA